MDEHSISLKEEYNNFRNELTKNIKNIPNNIESEDCYLIEESINNKIFEYFNNHNDILNNKININFNEKTIPNIIINDFNSCIKSLKNKKKLKLISKQLIEAIYKGNDLRQFNNIKYYAGNNKIIIEFKEQEDNKALLLINPLEENDKKENIFIISTKNKNKNYIFEELLNKNDNLEKYCNIISVDRYLKIIKLLVEMFYYEKTLYENKKEEVCYLINSKWINTFKEYYNYSQIYGYLNNIADKFVIQDNNCDDLFNNFLDNKIFINFDNDNNCYNAIKIEEIKIQEEKEDNSIKYCTAYYVVNEKILQIIKNIFNNSEIEIDSNKIHINNNYVYLVCYKKIIVGNIRETIFYPEYIFFYNKAIILSEEKNILLNTSVEDYINKFKKKLTKNKKPIGRYIIIQNDNMKREDKCLENISNINDKKRDNIMDEKTLTIESSNDNNIKEQESVKEKNIIHNNINITIKNNESYHNKDFYKSEVETLINQVEKFKKEIDDLKDIILKNKEEIDNKNKEINRINEE